MGRAGGADGAIASGLNLDRKGSGRVALIDHLGVTASIGRTLINQIPPHNLNRSNGLFQFPVHVGDTLLWRLR